MDLKDLIVMIIALIAVVLIPLSLKLIIRHLKVRKTQGHLLLNGKQCLMDRREYDLFNTMKSSIDMDMYSLFYAVPFSCIFGHPLTSPGPKALKSLDALTADFLICESKSLKPAAIILLDYDTSFLNLITTDVKIINLPGREFYTKKEIEIILERFKLSDSYPVLPQREASVT